MPRETALGKVVHVSPKGALLTRATGPVPVRLPGGDRNGTRIGESVADARREYVGRIADILGPVDRPYAVVLPERGAKLHRLLGQELYATPDVQPPRGPPRGGPHRGPPPSGRGPHRGPPTRGPPRNDARPDNRSGGGSRGPPPRGAPRGAPPGGQTRGDARNSNPRGNPRDRQRRDSR